MNRRSFFKGVAATLAAATIKVGARIFYVRTSAQLRTLSSGAQKVDKIMLKRGQVFEP